MVEPSTSRTGPLEALARQEPTSLISGGEDGSHA